MRKETSNQFSEGLISDLNPINTPKTALTDNLNGTIITYNGNEFSLQNDRGNYELKNCKLKPNYIPVGIKEHGDILYIVSYNPLDESVEVGSYPSPLQVNEIDAESDELDFGSIIKSEIIDGPKTQGYNNYSKLVTKEKYIVFNGEDYKLYPGDMYKLETGPDSSYRYEKFEYFILDEESNTHNITEEIKNPKTVDENGFSYVGWDIPGWITAKARLARLASAGLNVRSFYAPKTENGRSVFYEFNMRLNIEDDLLKSSLFGVDNLYQSEILFDVIFSGTTDTEYPKYENITISDITEWYKDNKIVWRNLRGDFNTSTDDIITVTLIPKLIEYKDSIPLYTIIYDNLKQYQEFDLSRVNDKPWNAGESLYKYYVNGDKSELRLEFNVDGPTVSSSKISLEYKIKDLNNNYIIGSDNNWETFDDYYGIGDNYITIPFDKIQKEEIYILDWRFKSETLNQNGDPELLNNIPSRLIITTELLDGSEKSSLYDRDITMDELLNIYFEKILLNEPIISSSDLKKIQFETKVLNDNDSVQNFCNPDISDSIFVKEVEPLPSEIELLTGYKCEQDIEISQKIDKIEGGLWKNLLNNKVILYTDYGEYDITKQRKIDILLSKINKISTSVIGSPINYVHSLYHKEAIDSYIPKFKLDAHTSDKVHDENSIYKGTLVSEENVYNVEFTMEKTMNIFNNCWKYNINSLDYQSSFFSILTIDDSKGSSIRTRIFGQEGCVNTFLLMPWKGWKREEPSTGVLCAITNPIGSEVDDKVFENILKDIEIFISKEGERYELFNTYFGKIETSEDYSYVYNIDAVLTMNPNWDYIKTVQNVKFDNCLQYTSDHIKTSKFDIQNSITEQNAIVDDFLNRLSNNISDTKANTTRKLWTDSLVYKQQRFVPTGAYTNSSNKNMINLVERMTEGIIDTLNSNNAYNLNGELSTWIGTGHLGVVPCCYFMGTVDNYNNETVS